MGVCVPKHIVCGWFDPKTDQTPVFVSGAMPCTLASYTETRARYSGVDFLFRSIDIGAGANGIGLALTWLVDDGGSFRPFDTLTDTEGDVALVRLDVDDGTISEIYYAVQQRTETLPIGSGVFTWVNGISQLIPQLNSGIGTPPSVPGQPPPTTGPSTLVVLPPIDDAVPVNAPLPDVSFLPEFSSTMIGGSSGPPSPNGIRTGPGSSMIHMIGTEVPSGDVQIDKLNDGTIQPITGSAVRSWNGACFVGVNQSIGDCEDPNNPPADCTGPICT